MMDPTKRFSDMIIRIDDTKNVNDFNVTMLLPILNSKELNINVPNSFSGNIELTIMMVEMLSS